MNKSYKRIILTIFKLSITLVILLYFIFKSDWHDFFAKYRLTAKGYFFVCLLVFFALLVDAIRFLLILKIWGINLTFAKVLYINWIGLFFNNVLPGSVGGDLMKSYFLYKMGHKFVNVLFVSFLDRFCGLYGLIVDFSPGLYPLYVRNKGVFFGALSIYLSFFLITIVFVKSKFLQAVCSNLIKKIPLIREYHDSIFLPFQECLKNPVRFLPPISISILTHIFLISAFFIATTFWHGSVQHQYMNFFSIVPFGFMITALPISISGWGTGEAGFAFIYSIFGYPANVGFAVSVLYKFTLLILSIPGFVLWIFWLFKGNIQEKTTL